MSGTSPWTCAARICRHEDASGSQLHEGVQGVHGVDGGRGPGALLALGRVPACALPAILADERAVLVELPVSALAVVDQAVVAVVSLNGPVGRRAAPFQRLVVLVVTVGENDTQVSQERGRRRAKTGQRGRF